MYQLKVIIASTRPGRKGPAIAEWFCEIAAQRKDFSVEVIDLAAVNLPIFDEPHHPRFRNYEHRHTKDWSAMVEPADAYVFVTPEYNYSFPASLKNALDYLYNEWNYKPAGFVSYGGVAAGTRAVQMLKQVVTAQKMMPVPESVNIPFFTRFINEDGYFTGDPGLNKSAEDMLDELAKWAGPLKAMRAK